MRVVTTCHKEGYEQYGHRILDGWNHWPRSTELHWYVEDYEVPETAGITTVNLERLQGLQSIKHRYSHYKPPSYLFDVARYANKVYAACDALMDYKGIGVWMDADCVTFKDIPEGYIDSLLEKGAYLACFQRTGLYTETGFWVMDCSHEQHQSFLLAWQEWYESNAFAALTGWTDCHTLDATIRKFKGAVAVTNLSGEHADNMHPMALSPLGAYIDHCKGPRKVGGFSPENAHRGAA
jgi:hypothetical protein